MDAQPSLRQIFRRILIQEVPAYANRFFYSLGLLSAVSFLVLIVTGVIMVAVGPTWWLTTGLGHLTRSLHLWATQAFVLFMLLHLLVVWLTSGYRRPRRLTWVIGSLMFAFVLAEAEFGYVLRADYSSQWRALQGADLYNGSGIGAWLNNLNTGQIYGIHIALIPILLIALLLLHYLLIRSHGIAEPYRADVKFRRVPANHRRLYWRSGLLVALITVLAFAFPAPYLKPVTVAEVASTDSALFAQTLMLEYDRGSDTATYQDSIAPYTFDTRQIYVTRPYQRLLAAQSAPNQLDRYAAEPAPLRAAQLKAAQNYFEKQQGRLDPQNPLESTLTLLTAAARTGLYQAVVQSEASAPTDPTYLTRFLADTGVLESKAQSLGMTTDQYGMLREESGQIPPGAWWLAPVGLLDHTLLANDANQDRDGAEILGLLLLLLVAWPFIPYLNQLPDKLRVYRLIWRE